MTLGPGARPALAELLQRLGDDNAKMSHLADLVIQAIGPLTDAEVPALVEALQHASPKTRRFAVTGLRSVGGRAARPALAPLAMALADSDAEVTYLAEAALESLKPLGQDDEAALLPLLRAKSKVVREYAARALDAIADVHALAATPQNEQSLQALAVYLTESATTDRRKAREVYRWIADRVAYDAESFFAGRKTNQSAEAVFKTRLGVCEGYSNLFGHLCKLAGLKTVQIGGCSAFTDDKQKDSNPLHGWNAVFIDDAWHLVDVTWGAGTVDTKGFSKHFTDYFFMPPPDELIFNHLPTDAKWQLLEKPLSMAEWLKLPTADFELFEMGFDSSALKQAAAAPGFREFVETYAGGSQLIRFKKAPVARHLPTGAKVEIVVVAVDARSVAFLVNGDYVDFTQSDGAWTGTIQPTVGPLKVMVQWKNDEDYHTVLRYDVKAPPADSAGGGPAADKSKKPDRPSNVPPAAKAAPPAKLSAPGPESASPGAVGSGLDCEKPAKRRQMDSREDGKPPSRHHGHHRFLRACPDDRGPKAPGPDRQGRGLHSA